MLSIRGKLEYQEFQNKDKPYEFLRILYQNEMIDIFKILQNKLNKTL